MRRATTTSILLALTAAAAAAGGPAQAQIPIPEIAADRLERYRGAAVEPRPFPGPAVPRHPHMAPNGRSNLHEDAFQTDTLDATRVAPLGNGTRRVASNFFIQECASITFDSRGRIVTVCVGIGVATLRILHPETLAVLAEHQLPARNPLGGTGNPFTSFGGGGYFYLDDRDRAVVPGADRHIRVIAALEPARLRLEDDLDVTSAVPDGDTIISALPDWSGRIWFASAGGVVGTVDPRTRAVRAIGTGEPIGNSFAVDADGSVSIVTDAALYRFEAEADGTPRAVWRLPYENTGEQKPGQTQAGSGTTPTLIGDDLVAITDNADPINVVVARRGREAEGDRVVCRQPVFPAGASATDQSLIAAGRTIIAENNHGYDILRTQFGGSTAPGLARVDVDEDGRGCRLVWTAQERAPSAVPKLSLATGLVYTWTKDPSPSGEDGWYLTAVDVRTGETRWKALGGEGLGHNNNYAPITIAPDGSMVLGVLGGIVRLADAVPPRLAPPATEPAAREPLLRLRCRGGRIRASVASEGVRRATFRAGRWARTDRRRPFSMVLPRAARRASARVVRTSGKVRKSSRRVPRCATAAAGRSG